MVLRGLSPALIASCAALFSAAAPTQADACWFCPWSCHRPVCCPQPCPSPCGPSQSFFGPTVTYRPVFYTTWFAPAWSPCCPQTNCCSSGCGTGGCGMGGCSSGNCASGNCASGNCASGNCGPQGCGAMRANGTEVLPTPDSQVPRTFSEESGSSTNLPPADDGYAPPEFNNEPLRFPATNNPSPYPVLGRPEPIARNGFYKNPQQGRFMPVGSIRRAPANVVPSHNAGWTTVP